MARTEFTNIINPSMITCPSPREGYVGFNPNEKWIHFGETPLDIAEEIKRARKADQVNRIYSRRLDKFESGLASVMPNGPKTPEAFINETFPNANIVFMHPDKSHNYDTPYEYATLSGLDNARGFYGWIQDQLPPQFRPEILIESQEATLEDLLTFHQINPQSNNRDIRMQHESTILLALTQLSGVVELSQHPGIDKQLAAFSKDLGRVFQGSQEQLMLQINLDNHGKTTRARDVLTQRDEQSSQNTDIQALYRARRYGVQRDQYIIIENRQGKPKATHSAMLKILRERAIPLGDTLGGRIILGERAELPLVLQMLRAGMTEWDVNPEKNNSPAPESIFKDLSKYTVEHKTRPDLPIELQIYWLKDQGQILNGNWIPKRFEGGSNDYAYRMKQILRIAAPKLYPSSIYQIVWSDKKVIETCMNYADKQAVIGG